MAQDVGPTEEFALDPRLFGESYDNKATIENQNEHSELSGIALLDTYNKGFPSEERNDHQIPTTDAAMITQNADSSPYPEYPQLFAYPDGYQQWQPYGNEHHQLTYVPTFNTTDQQAAPTPSMPHNTPSSSSSPPAPSTSPPNPKKLSSRARTFREKLEAVNGVIIPSKLDIGQIPSKPQNLGHDHMRERVCPICRAGFRTNYHVQSHFASCVEKHGNPRGAKWDDLVLDHATKRGLKPGEVRWLGDGQRGREAGSSRGMVYRSRSESPWGCFDD